MQHTKGCRERATVRVLLMLISMLGLLLGVGGCGSDDPVRITSISPLPNGTIGQTYDYDFESANGGQFWVLQSGELPPGLALQSDGILSGVPTTAGTFTFSITVFQEVIEEFFDPFWYDPDFGFFGPIDPEFYDDFAVGLERDSASFSLTIN